MIYLILHKDALEYSSRSYLGTDKQNTTEMHGFVGTESGKFLYFTYILRYIKQYNSKIYIAVLKLF